jgi:manganese/zinc/iron transport system permease protein
LLIIPAAAARFWTFRLRHMLWLSGAFGALSGMLGSAFSALMANLPAGAVIILTASIIFLFSMTFGSARGILRLVIERFKLRKRILWENLLRDLYEWHESAHTASKVSSFPVTSEVQGPSVGDLLARRSWSARQLQRTIKALTASKNLIVGTDDRLQFTDQGIQAAQAIVRKHRLWEAYLITHADVATGMVDLSADRIEHVLDEEIIRTLEGLFPSVHPKELPKSLHELKTSGGAV